MQKDEEFVKKLLSIFRVEAAEHITAISSALFKLDKSASLSERDEIIEIIYRSAHSLKGASRSVNMLEMESLCQSMEDLIVLLKRGGIALTDDIKNLLNDTNDLLTEMIASEETGLNIEQGIRIQYHKENLVKAASGSLKFLNTSNQIRLTGDEPPPGIHVKSENQLKIENEITGKTVADRRKRPENTVNKLSSAPEETIRVSASKLESILMRAEELVSVKISARHYSSEIENIQQFMTQRSKEWVEIFTDLKKTSLKENMDRYGAAGAEEKNYTELLKQFINFNDKFKTDIEHLLGNLKKDIADDYRSSALLVDDLLSDMKNIILMPFSYTFEILPKIVRDISREQDKEINLILKGSEVEIDRRVLQEMKDPFIHLIRNCIDHGIEVPALRKTTGKPAKGTIEILINQVDASKVEIIISDDGAGIDPGRVGKAALELGTLSGTEYEKLNHDELIDLIFESGVSTSPIITTVSGRGLGLAIVREKAEKLGGSVSVKSVHGKGTEFHIILPVTIATFRGILIECGGQMFVVPTQNVERISRVEDSEIKNVENRETITYNQKAISLVRLDSILELPPYRKNENENFVNVMIIPAGSKYIGFTIDRVVNEDEMLLKNLGRQLRHVRNISGATVLASGDVVAVLNVPDIVKSVTRISGVNEKPVFSVTGKLNKDKKRKTVLVVEDSITARSLYVNILEAVGYAVSSAVDGIDGYTKLINGNFDLVVTDVQMPKMNGFELTEKIRRDERYSNIPVVLVTGLESGDDKKRGIDAGANAYVVKSSFDQNNLLEIIERFI